MTISRAAGAMTFPSEFMLVAAMNPSPDGKMPGESRSSPCEIQNHLGRISGHLLDRMAGSNYPILTAANLSLL